MTSEIIYRHPKGRFAVRRVTFPPGPLGSAARSYCETIWTPEDDVRGLCPPLPIRTDAESAPGAPERAMRNKKVPEDERQRIRRMYETGQSIGQIAQALGRADETVRRYLMVDGLREPKLRRAWTDEERRTARALLAQGVKRKEIARKLGRTVSAIYNEITREEQR